MEKSCFPRVQLYVLIVRRRPLPLRQLLLMFLNQAWNVTEVTHVVQTFVSEVDAVGLSSKKAPSMTLNKRGTIFLKLVLQGLTVQDRYW